MTRTLAAKLKIDKSPGYSLQGPKRLLRSKGHESRAQREATAAK
jgi:hypothetical protein